ncbi:MAG: alanyl-tRNA synthetase [Flavobacteriaceae bacterium]|jgi:alanyl-tRNA synthetase
MKPLTSKEIRELFLDFFRKNNHRLIEGSSIIPKDDPSLLYINSGMAPLKPYFLGLETPPSKQLVNVQPCIRTNDIEEIGDRHHLTFFEMMGSWSIGDYYKEKAIQLAFDLLVGHFKFDKEKLYVTVYKGDPELDIAADEESIEFWKKAGIDDDHIIALGADNFWGPAGDTGPCGPCTEVFYDTGDKFGPKYVPGEHFDDESRYIEIWNAGVFMELDKTKEGNFNPLPMKSVDTGSGIERMYLALNGIDSLYEVDTIKPVYDKIKDLFASEQLTEKDYRTLTDHMRTATMILSDGVLPSPDGRGYIPRRLIRKSMALAMRAGKSLDSLIDVAKEVMLQLSDYYPNLKDNSASIINSINDEIQAFTPILKEGIDLLDQKLESLQGKELDGEFIFNLVTTHGVPLENISDHVRERGFNFDEDSYWKHFRIHQGVSRGKKKQNFGDVLSDLKVQETIFLGYTEIEATATILHLIKDNEPVSNVSEGEVFQLIVDQTPFYGESGGQVGDIGVAITSSGKINITDTQKTNSIVVHYCELTEGELAVGQTVQLNIDTTNRDMIRRNHTATHLLHSSLREVLGTHLEQRGSLVNHEKLRLDFSHSKKITDEEIIQVEEKVNSWIRNNYKADVKLMDYDSAVKNGAMALFKENYGDEVRVVRFGDVSTELCGGNHVSETNDIGMFLITKETSSSKGIRRIEGITWQKAYENVVATKKIVKEASEFLSTSPEDLLESISKLKTKSLGSKKAAPTNTVSLDASDIDEKTIALPSDKKLLVGRLNEDKGALRGAIEQKLKNKEADFVLMISVNNDKILIMIGVSDQMKDELPAGMLIQESLKPFGGRGGGHNHLAQGGIPDKKDLDSVVALAEKVISEKL